MLHKEEELIRKLVQQTMLCNCGLKKLEFLHEFKLKIDLKLREAAQKGSLIEYLNKVQMDLIH